jgi:hypothetical protein
MYACCSFSFQLVSKVVSMEADIDLLAARKMGGDARKKWGEQQITP